MTYYCQFLEIDKSYLLVMDTYDSLVLGVIALVFIITGLSSLRVIYSKGMLSPSELEDTHKYYLNLTCYANIAGGMLIGFIIFLAFANGLS